MEQEKNKEKGINLRLFLGIIVVAMIMGVLLYFQFNRSEKTSVSPNSETKISDSQPGNIKQNPAENPPPANSKQPDQNSNNESAIITNPNIDNMITDPLKGEKDTKLIQLKSALIIQRDLYFMMIRKMEAEQNPAIKTQLEKDLKVIEQKINELQKAIDNLEN